MADLPPNHHADYPQFSGLFGHVAGLTMIIGRGRDAQLVADLCDLQPNDRALDIGCGPGTAVRHVAERCASVTGVDPAEPMLRLARVLTRLRRPSGEIDWVQAGAEDLTLPDESFTACWSLASVHHWPDLTGGIDEVKRVLAPNGTFVAIEKRTEPEATGNASHGWTSDQAAAFAGMLTEHGFSSTEVTDHELGRRSVVAVTASK